MTPEHAEQDPPARAGHRRHLLLMLCWVIILGSGLYFRSAGLFRGLESGTLFHPDAAKQADAFFNYMNDRYVWYHGSLFYDGYPLFLNHLDAWITRAVMPCYEGVRRHLLAERETPRLEAETPATNRYPKGFWIYYWLRFLRVVYGMAVIPAAYLLARCLGIRQSFSLAAALLVALSPIEWVVAHSATGDISVTLFASGLFLACWRHVRTGRCLPLIGAGILGGFAFAGKYHGMLVWGVPLAILALNASWHWRRRLFHILLFLAAALGGILVATPQFFIHARRTRRLIFANIEFIKNYNVPPEMLEKPFIERALIGLRQNAPALFLELGPLLVLLALGGAVTALVVWWKKRRDIHSPDYARNLFACSLTWLPVYALLLSLVGKINVQTFHFCYLNIPLILAAFYGIEHCRAAARPAFLRFLAPAAIAALFLATLPSMLREHFFWRRQETAEVRHLLASNLLDHRQTMPMNWRPVRVLENERGGLPVFRNRAVQLLLPEAPFWHSNPVLPLPDIPFPEPLYWIFDNGPVLPRNDRSFLVPRNETLERSIIWEHPPEQIKMGLRSGTLPTWITIRTAGRKKTRHLPPNQQTIIEWSPAALVPQQAPREQEPFAHRLTVSFSTRNGPAWVSLLSSASAEHVFRLYGGEFDELPDGFADVDVPHECIVRNVTRCAFYGRDPDEPASRLAAPGPVSTRRLLNYAPLPAGLYLFEADIQVLEPDTVLRLHGGGMLPAPDTDDTTWTALFELEPGHHTVVWPVKKAFAPYNYSLEFTVERGQTILHDWTLRPDTLRLIEDIDLWRTDGIRPAWAQALPASCIEVTPNQPEGLQFGQALTLDYLHLPPQRGDLHALRIKATMRQVAPMNHLAEQVAFIHFLDEEKKTRGVIGWPVLHALAAPGHTVPLVRPMDASLSGTYTMWMGVVSARTEKRLRIRRPPAGTRVRDHRVFLGEVTFP